MSGEYLDPLLALWTTLAIAVAVSERRLLRVVSRSTESPKQIAVFRILLGICLLLWASDLIALRYYLFSGDGVLPTADARRLIDLGPGSPLDLVGALISGRLSLLHLFDGAAAVDLHFGVLALSTTLMIFGVATRFTKWIAFVCFHSLAARNPLFRGGEQVFAAFFLLLCLSRCGAAFSYDSWRRQKRGRPLVQRVPAWPRTLMVLQTIPLFFTNGLGKTGAAWWHGDTLAFVLSHPHHAAVPRTWLEGPFVLELLRPVTWIAHSIELFYPLAVVGYFVVMFRSLQVRSSGGVTTRVLLACFALTGALVAGSAFTARELWWTLPGRVTLLLSALGVIALVLPRRAYRLPYLRPVVTWACDWRVWVPLVALLTGGIVLTTNVGWFPLVAMATTVLLVPGARSPAPRHRSSESGLEQTNRRQRLSALAVSAYCTLHVCAVFWALMPHGAQHSGWRPRVDQAASHWISAFRTPQVWLMFAPGAPEHFADIEAELHLADGRVVPKKDHLPGRTAPVRFPGRAKATKIARRLLQYPSWRARHAAFLCRQSDPAPTQVVFYRVSYRIELGSPAKEIRPIRRRLQEIACG